MKYLRFYPIYTLVFVLGFVICEELVTVNIEKKLKITGTKFDVPEIEKDKEIYQFLGVEYARIPSRFTKAELITEGTVNATKPGPICYQNIMPLEFAWKLTEIPQMSEDCLFLNIWTPNLNPNAKLPVLFYIHGGGFTSGFGHFHKGDILTSLHDIVFVSINYRLGALGFFSTGDKVVPGNLGLLDQLDALKWVNKFITYFGGDPEQVTLTGVSAGSISVSYHIVSPLSRGLFKRGIMQSGTSIGRFGRTQKESQDYLKKIAEAWKTDSAEATVLLEMAKQMDAETLVKFNQSLAFSPVVDDNFLPDLPVNLYNKDEFSHVDIITGYTKNDGFLLMFYFAKYFLKIDTSRQQRNISKENVMDFIGKFFSLIMEMNNREFLELVYKEYVGDNTRSIDKLRNIELICRDSMFASGTFDGAQRHSKYSNAYVYEYNHRETKSKKPAWVVADHGDDTMMPTGDCLRQSFNGTCSSDAIEVSKTIMQYWVNFATSGNPNGADVTYWPKYTCKTQNYLELDKYPRVQAVYNPDRVQLWMETIFKMDNKREGVYVPRNNPCDHSHSHGDHSHEEDDHSHAAVPCNKSPSSSVISIFYIYMLILPLLQFS